MRHLPRLRLRARARVRTPVVTPAVTPAVTPVVTTAAVARSRELQIRTVWGKSLLTLHSIKVRGIRTIVSGSSCAGMGVRAVVGVFWDCQKRRHPFHVVLLATARLLLNDGEASSPFRFIGYRPIPTVPPNPFELLVVIRRGLLFLNGASECLAIGFTVSSVNRC